MSVRLNTDNRPAQQHPLDSRGMERLPEDVLTQVLGGLNQHDIQASVLVSRAMKERVITTVNTNELDSIKNFIKSLIQGLPADVFPRQRAAFAAILEQVSSRAFVNLSPLKRYALEAKQQLIDVLKTIDPEAVPRIGKVPQFMENIFPLAAVYREIDHAVNTRGALSARLPDSTNRSWRG